MCGILLVVGTLESVAIDTVRKALYARGPDSVRTEARDGAALTVSVLHIRGSQLVSQPLCTERFSFAWNGEAYNSQWTATGNDTEALFQELQHSDLNIPHVFAAVTGPFAFVVVDWQAHCAYYGKDTFGQRSLLLKHEPKGVVISSVTDGLGEWTEVPAGTVFRLDFSTREISTVHRVESPSALRFGLVAAGPTLEEMLSASVDRLARHQHVAVMFSGGLDSTLIATLVARSQASPHIIYLLNVSCSPDSPDRLTALYSHSQLCALYPEKEFRLLCIDPSPDAISSVQEALRSLLHPKNTQMDLSITTPLWFAALAVGRLASCVPLEGVKDMFTGNEGKTRTPHQPSDYGLATRELPPINPSDYITDTEDRYPGKVILSGLGADELCGGYSRYRTAFETSGESALIACMSQDLDRLFDRNLGRDDRVLASHSRECLYPFLDAEVLRSLARYPLCEVCDMQRVRGFGDKAILRRMAHSLGLTLAAGFEKRAIQFGSRSAQLYNALNSRSNREAKGTDAVERTAHDYGQEEVQWATLKTLLRLCYEADNAQQVDLLKGLMDERKDILGKRTLLKSNFGDLKAKMRKNPLVTLVQKLRKHDWRQVLASFHLQETHTFANLS